jgi:hypothetical protein
LGSSAGRREVEAERADGVDEVEAAEEAEADGIGAVAEE